MSHRKIALVLTIFIITGTILASCGQKATPEPAVSTPEGGYTPLVNATGKIVPVEWATLSMSANGVAEEVLVKEGEAVQRGQVLVRLDGKERLAAQVSAAELARLQAQQAIDQLNRNWNQARAAATLRLADAKKALDLAGKRRLSPGYNVGNRNQIDAAYANYVLAQEEVERLEELFGYVQDRAEIDSERAMLLSQLAAARTQRDLAKANLNYLSSLPNEIEVGVTDARVNQAQAEVDAAQRDLDQLKNGPDPDQLALAQAALKNAEEQLKAVESALADLELKAPFDGTVSRVYLRAQESVLAGSPVMQLANLQELRVETTDLSEIDVARIDPGSIVTVTFDALPDMTVNGVVSQIAPRAAEGSGVNYTVIVQLDEIPDGLRWGMTAFADIQVTR